MAERRILQLGDSGEFLIATETTFESEEALHRAIASHPEVIPSEDLGMGPLVTVANEIDFGHGPIDTLGVDGAGRLAIIEFKRGSENPDVRKVVAQVLDYGSSLWRLPYEQLEQTATGCEPGLKGSLAEHVEHRLAALGAAAFDAEAFQRGVETCLDTGEFVFLYIARDLDDRTRRIMTFLAEGPRMSFFAVEVDYFRSPTGGAVLVPRVAFLPSWVGQSGRPAGGVGPTLVLEEAPEPVRLLAPLLDELADELGLVVSQARASRIYRPAKNAPGVTMYLDGHKVEFDLESFRSRGEESFADDFCARLDSLAGKPVKRGPYPGLQPAALLEQWHAARVDLIEHYFAARLEHIAREGEPRPLDVDRLHQLLRRLPKGKWTTYGDVAVAVGSHPRAVGGHIGNCPACENAWRVLQTSGVVSAAFRWSDPERRDDPRVMLETEGVRFDGSKADPKDRLTRQELVDLLSPA